MSAEQQRQPRRRGLTLEPVANVVRRVLARHPPAHPTEGPDGPRDCVRVFPALNGTVNLLGYDTAGVVQLEVRMSEDRMQGDWQAWILDWLHSFESTPDRPALTLLDDGEDHRKAATRPLPGPGNG